MQLNTFFPSADTMPQMQRIQHIDSLRGVAVLLMVMVHAAATWNPFHSPQPTLLAYIISGLGGLAAPLFVTLFGWGVLRSELSLRQRLFQSLFLFAMQILVNLTSPHLFQTFTPGVLSLMALLNLVLPMLSSSFKDSKVHPILWLTTLVFLIQFLYPEIQGEGSWSDRVNDASFFIVASNLFFTGTYPLFPWILFAALGATISANGTNQGASVPSIHLIRYSILFGLLFCLVSFYISQINNELWAHPTADATLTFFPANTAFLIAAFTGVMILWLMIQRLNPKSLSSAGKMSLTIYVVHFIPLTWMQDYELTYQWGLTTSSIAVVAYSLIWIPLSAQWLKRYPKATLEATLKEIRKSL